MTQNNQIYKCQICGNVVEVLHNGVGTLVCCGQPMDLMLEKDKDEGKEKHLPVIEFLPPSVCKVTDGIKVRIGENLHPMQEEHYIEWIEVKTAEGKIGKRFLNPTDVPEVEFNTRSKILEVRAYCNIHGLWKKILTY